MAHRTPTSGCKQVGDDKVATLLSTTIEIPRNGYLYIYTSNETKNIDVYFDNLQLSHTRSPLLEENNYYAFGGDIKALCSKAIKGLAYINNNAKFNSGTEFNDDLDVALYETPFRNYNAQIGRFQGIDKLSELTPSLTPMQFGGNNPISFNDPSGLACADAPMIGGPLEDATVYGTIGGGGSAAWSRSSYLVSLEIMNSYYGSIAESNGGSGSDGRPDGWVPDGDSYKYVNDKTKGVKEKVFIDPATGKTMHGDENGNLVAVPQVLMDAMVSGTRHVAKPVSISPTFNPSVIAKLTQSLLVTPGIQMEGYFTRRIREGKSPVEAVVNGRTGKPESTTFSTQGGMVNLSLSCGVDGSVTVGNGFLSLGTTDDGRYIFDLSIPTGSNSSMGTTFYYNPDIFINNMRYFMNTVKDALRSSSPAFYPIPTIPLPILIP